MILLKRQFSRAEKTGATALILAGITSLFAPFWSMCILLLFLSCCGIAPFLPQTGFFLPIVYRGDTSNNSIALTFDDGPSPHSTPYILHLLAKENIKATFFIIGKKADQYPELIKKILDNGHSVGNHSWSHDNFLMFRTPKILACDLRKTQTVLARFRVHPLAFRPPVGITGPRLWPVLERLNMFAVNFSCRAYDRGNRNVKKLAGSILKRVRPGDILLLHDARPLQGGQEELWKKELSHLFSELKTHYRIVPLETLIGRPVMEYIDPKESAQE